MGNTESSTAKNGHLIATSAPPAPVVENKNFVETLRILRHHESAARQALELEALSIIREHNAAAELATHRCSFKEAIKTHDKSMIRSFLSNSDANELLMAKDADGYLPLHDACLFRMPRQLLQLLLDSAVKHEIIKSMLEAKKNFRSTCLHYACESRMPCDTLQLLLEYLSKHADIKKMLEKKNYDGVTCLHLACGNNLSPDSLRLLLDYLSKHADIKNVLEQKDNDGWTCLHRACANNLSVDSFRFLVEYLSKHANIKKMLEERTKKGANCLHLACDNNLSPDSLRLLLDYLSKHADIEKVLEEKNGGGWTCLHVACRNDLPTDSFRLLLEYLSKHADLKKLLEEKNSYGTTCLHLACAYYLSINSLRLLISFFPSNGSLQLVLGSKDYFKKTPLDRAKTEEHKQLLQDPNCWQKCRYWLFCNYQEVFLNTLYSNSPEKTLEALKELKELKKNYANDETLKKDLLHRENFVDRLRTTNTNPDDSAARQVLELAALSTAEDFHRDYIIQREKVEVRQLITDSQKLKLLSEEDLDRQELEKFIFDRLPITHSNREAISILFKNAITVETFLLLTVEEFREMGVQMGPRIHFLLVIEQEKSLRQQQQQQSLTARSDVDALVAHHQSISARQHSDSAAVPHLNFLSLQQTAGVPVPVTKRSKDHEVRSFDLTESTEVVSVNGGATNSTKTISF